MTNSSLLVRTTTRCPWCYLKLLVPADRSSIILPARIFEQGNKVWLCSFCQSHGPFKSIISSSSGFYKTFERRLTLAHGLPSEPPTNPFCVTVPLTAAVLRNKRTWPALLRKLKNVAPTFTRLSLRSVTHRGDLSLLDDLAHAALRAVSHQSRVVVELSPPNLASYMEIHPNALHISERCIPAARVDSCAGNEADTLSQIHTFLVAVASLDPVGAHITLAVERRHPLPDLSWAIAALRLASPLVRRVVIELHYGAGVAVDLVRNCPAPRSQRTRGTASTLRTMKRVRPHDEQRRFSAGGGVGSAAHQSEQFEKIQSEPTEGGVGPLQSPHNGFGGDGGPTSVPSTATPLPGVPPPLSPDTAVDVHTGTTVDTWEGVAAVEVFTSHVPRGVPTATTAHPAEVRRAAVQKRGQPVSFDVPSSAEAAAAKGFPSLAYPRLPSIVPTDFGSMGWVAALLPAINGALDIPVSAATALLMANPLCTLGCILVSVPPGRGVRAPSVDTPSTTTSNLRKGTQESSAPTPPRPEANASVAWKRQRTPQREGAGDQFAPDRRRVEGLGLLGHPLPPAHEDGSQDAAAYYTSPPASRRAGLPPGSAPTSLPLARIVNLNAVTEAYAAASPPPTTPFQLAKSLSIRPVDLLSATSGQLPSRLARYEGVYGSDAAASVVGSFVTKGPSSFLTALRGTVEVAPSASQRTQLLMLRVIEGAGAADLEKCRACCWATLNPTTLAIDSECVES